MNNQLGCQLHCLPTIAEGKADLGEMPVHRHMKLWLKRHLSGPTKRKIKKFTLQIMEHEHKSTRHSSSGEKEMTNSEINPGDLVRVKPDELIKATLNTWGEYKYCRFMEGMWQYCGSEQRVFKCVERFVDERDYQIKKASGVVLLENLYCPGTDDYGRCDRSCFYFWRVEWLEKVE